jgi:hypothetical protein
MKFRIFVGMLLLVTTILGTLYTMVIGSELNDLNFKISVLKEEVIKLRKELVRQRCDDK